MRILFQRRKDALLRIQCSMIKKIHIVFLDALSSIVIFYEMLILLFLGLLPHMRILQYPNLKCVSHMLGMVALCKKYISFMVLITGKVGFHRERS